MGSSRPDAPAGSAAATPMPIAPPPGNFELGPAKAQFAARRCFTFLHHFCGTSDFNLGQAVVEAASARGLVAKHISVDRVRDGTDLTAPEPYGEHLALALKDGVDGYHGGYPCGSFSRVRFRRRPGMPGPVRDATYRYGLPTNSASQQAEADKGTLMCARTLSLAAAVRDSALRRGVPPVATAENPEPPGEPILPSSFHLDETIDFMLSDHVVAAAFPLCRFGSEFGKRMVFFGVLGGLSGWSSECVCKHKHTSLSTPELVKLSGEYPRKLCEAYANLVADSWLRTLDIEFAASVRTAPPAGLSTSSSSSSSFSRTRSHDVAFPKPLPVPPAGPSTSSTAGSSSSSGATEA